MEIYFTSDKMNRNPSRKPAARRPSIRSQVSHTPQKATPRLEQPIDSVISVQEKTSVEINDEKMAAMAANPDAITVYMTEKGIDPKGWSIVFPEYKVLCDAFKGGYSWHDITVGRGKHLLPKQKPYKIVHVSSTELNTIRAAEAEIVTKNAELLCQKQEKERDVMVHKDAIGATQKELCELQEKERNAMAYEDAISTTQEKQILYEHAIKTIMSDIYVLPQSHRTQEIVTNLVVNRLFNYNAEDRDAIACGVCELIGKENILSDSSQTQSPGVTEPSPYNIGYENAPFIYADGSQLFVPGVYIPPMMFPSVSIPLPTLLSDVCYPQPIYNMPNTDPIHTVTTPPPTDPTPAPYKCDNKQCLECNPFQIVEISDGPLPHICDNKHCVECNAFPRIDIIDGPLPPGLKIVQTITLLPPPPPPPPLPPAPCRCCCCQAWRDDRIHRHARVM